MEKERLKFIFLFTFVIFSLSFISSASCSITTSCSPDNTVMKLSSNSNAHGALYNQGSYTNYLCCDFTGTHTCSGTNTVLRLSSSTNAHAELKTKSNYADANRVCFGLLTCYDTTSSCNSGDIQMVSLSEDTNAHIGSFGTYGTKICCNFNLGFCGNGVIETGETCDDGNINSGDGCSSTCQGEPYYTCDGKSPTCCYEVQPPTFWKLNGVSFSGGNIKKGDVLTMIIGDTYCLSSGTSVSFEIVEGSTVRATVSGTIVGNTLSANYVVTDNFLSALSGTSNIYFRIRNPTVLQSSSISVTPIGCEISSASWSHGSQIEGQQVQLNIQTTNCDNGEAVSFVVKENDALACIGGDDDVKLNPANVQISGNSATGTWTAEFQEDNDCVWENNPPEYYFDVKIVSNGDTMRSSNELEVEKLEVGPCGDGICASDESCLTCSTDCGQCYCGDGDCNNGETCTSCSSDCGTCPVVIECGNGVIESGETCDDDNTKSGDGCSSTCQIEDGWICTYTPSVCKEIPPCEILSTTWLGLSSVTEGTRVTLSIQTANCNNGEAVSFTIKENDHLAGIGDDDVKLNPSNSQISGNSATATWTAEWQSEGWPETDPPEYYFTAEIISKGNTMKSSNELQVTKAITEPYCGDNLCNNGEICGTTNTAPECNSDCGICEVTLFCGDNLCNNGETCSTCQTDCGACAVCGNDIVESGEQCDDGSSNGQVCPASYGSTCTYCSSSCTTLTVQGPYMGDGIINGGEECDDGNTNSGDGCSSTGTIEDGWNCSGSPSVCKMCEITSASWNEELVEEGINVQLNVQTSNCNNGEIVSFVVKENDALFDGNVETNPENAVINENSVTGTWEAEFQDDSGLKGNGNPPEYYFDVEVLSNGDTMRSSDPLLEVTEKIECVLISSCANYVTSTSCISDSCFVSPDSIPSTITCGEGYDCGCSWDEDAEVCEPIWNPWPDCGNGVINTGEQCDGTAWGPITGCTDFDGFTGGDLDCKGCVFDTSSCTGGTIGVCGNGVINIGEQCDGTAWGPITGCTDFDGFTGGDLDCNRYCLFDTSECTGGISPEVQSIGKCYYTEQGSDTCEDDGKLTRTLIATWIWDALNPSQYDPQNKEGECSNVEDVLVCPAQIEVSFFGTLQFLLALALIILVYFLISKKKTKTKKSKTRK